MAIRFVCCCTLCSVSRKVLLQHSNGGLSTTKIRMQQHRWYSIEPRIYLKPAIQPLAYQLERCLFAFFIVQEHYDARGHLHGHTSHGVQENLDGHAPTVCQIRFVFSPALGKEISYDRRATSIHCCIAIAIAKGWSESLWCAA